MRILEGEIQDIMHYPECHSWNDNLLSLSMLGRNNNLPIMDFYSEAKV